MCSQPPKTVDDDWLLEEAFELVRLLPRDTPRHRLHRRRTDPLRRALFELLQLCRTSLPEAGVHVLSNGRRFAIRFAQAWAAIDNPNMMVGIPIYGTEPTLHDYVVQAARRVRRDRPRHPQPAAARAAHRDPCRHPQADRAYLVEIAEFISPQPAFRRPSRPDGTRDDRLRARQHRRRLDRPIDYQRRTHRSGDAPRPTGASRR